MNIFPLSPSKIKAFHNCPKQYKAIYIDKSVPFTVTEAITKGLEDHKLIELALKGELYLPDSLDYVRPLVDKVIEERNTREDIHHLPEQKVAIDRNWKVAKFFGKNTYVRGVVDLIRLDLNKGLANIIDWKTGNRWLNKDQLTLYAVMILQSMPTLKRIKATYVWLKPKKIDSFIIKQADVTAHRIRFDRDIKFIETSVQKELFPAWASPLCNYCPLLPNCNEGKEYNAKK